MRRPALRLICAVALIGCGPAAASVLVEHAEIPPEELNGLYAEQQRPGWCWAASIQTILAFHGVRISQQEIVRKFTGTDDPGAPAAVTFDAITANLSGWVIRDAEHRAYTLEVSWSWGPPGPGLLVESVLRREPLLLAYMSGPRTGHAVVVIGARYRGPAGDPTLLSVVVRDPWPSPVNQAARGRVEHPAEALRAHTVASWWIHVRALAG